MNVISPFYKGGGIIYTPESSIKDLRIKNSEYDTTIAHAESLVGKAKKLETEYKNFPLEAKNDLEIRIPETVDTVRLINEVSTIIEKSDFAPGDISYQISENLDGKGQNGYIISFTTKGTYPRFKTLIDNFEKSLRAYVIKNVNFSVPDTGKDLTTFQVRLETYYMK